MRIYSTVESFTEGQATWLAIFRNCQEAKLGRDPERIALVEVVRDLARGRHHEARDRLRGGTAARLYSFECSR